jgi:hypothetical protein
LCGRAVAERGPRKRHRERRRCGRCSVKRPAIEVGEAMTRRYADGERTRSTHGQASGRRCARVM